MSCGRLVWAYHGFGRIEPYGRNKHRIINEMAAYSAAGGRVSFQEEPPKLPKSRNKSLTSMSSAHEDDEIMPRRLSRNRTSEWAIRPLRVKFKTKELEDIYDRSVYRQQQELLIKACILVILVGITSVIVYLGKTKVFF